MASASTFSSSATPTPSTALRPGRTGSIRDEEDLQSIKNGFLASSRAAKDSRSVTNATMFGPRGASLANAMAPPGSFSSNLKSMNGIRNVGSRPELSTFPSREEVPQDEATASEKRQAEFREMINKETKIKTGSENLLEALLVKNSKQSKEQRIRVENELSSSTRKIAELKSKLAEEIERSKRPTTPNQNRLSALFRGSPLRPLSREDSASDLEEFEYDVDAESPTFVLAEILQSLELEGMQPDYYVSRANGLVDLFKRHPTLKYDLAWSIFGLRVQTMLLSDSREVVAAGYRVIRHAIADRHSLQTVRELHTDSMVILSLVKESKATIEREQALKFVRSFLDVKDGVQELSSAVLRTVVSVAEHHEDRLRNMAILTLAEILVRDPSLISSVGGFSPLLDALGDGSYPASESLTSAFLYLFDSPKTRKFLSTGRELEVSFAPFTDPLALIGHEDRLKVNTRSAACILSTWPGLFTLARDGFSALRSLLLSLCHPSLFARDLVLDLLFDVLHIKPPSWTSSFLAGRRLTTYGRVANLKADHLEDQSSVENEDDASRVNLIDQYISLVLAVLVHCGLIKVCLRS
jgi:rapamycin-insensitive companion of mTOR